MYSHQYLGTNSFPDVDFYHNQPSSRSPSLTQNTNAYQQSPSRVFNPVSGLIASNYAPAPTPHGSATFSVGHTPARSVSPEPWEAATSEFQVPAYRHEMPVFHYESQFSVNSVHDSLRDTGPWVYDPDGDCDARGPGKRQAPRTSRAAVALHGVGTGGEENSTGGSSSAKVSGKMKPRTAEQKLRMAESAATRRANDKNHLSIIKRRLPPLAYGQEYNNRTALAGAIVRFDQDEQELDALRKECSAIQTRLKNVEKQLADEKVQRESLLVERNNLQVRCARSEAEIERLKAERKTESANAVIQLQNSEAQYSYTHAALQRTEAELRYYKDTYGPSIQSFHTFL
ncbi:hypothetical protein DENSPDRAFT_164338 [Dentipellis sp. KUC8613]|nr:hypothetical protein DENSPDRAFT_164338 [Dentipellis sp. KUC8613]